LETRKNVDFRKTLRAFLGFRKKLGGTGGFQHTLKNAKVVKKR